MLTKVVLMILRTSGVVILFVSSVASRQGQ